MSDKATKKKAQPTENERRANDANEALIVFARRTGLDLNAGETPTAVVDLLASLRHFCDFNGLDLGDLDRQAHGHYLAELAEAR